jgi:anionic cell wall polymer biosynthesis LytR-Cps2A-Psr (LCP) family protein
VPTYFPYPARDLESNLAVRSPGGVRLDGPASLEYVRSRTLQYQSTMTHRWIDADIVPDIDRIARQQDFIRHLAALAVAKSLNDPLLANDVVDEALAKLKVDQNLSKADVLSLVDAFRTVNPNDTSALDFQTLPWQPGPNQSGQQVLYVKNPDAQAMVAQLMDFSMISPNHRQPNVQQTPSSWAVISSSAPRASSPENTLFATPPAASWKGRLTSA